MEVRKVLSVAGSDPSGGAGVQADLKTIAAHMLYGECVLTSLTAQNTVGVQGVLDVPAAFVSQQLESVFSDVPPDAVKVGMVSSAAGVRAVAEGLRAHAARNVVVDPVMVATSGGTLLKSEALGPLIDELLPLADIVTPNLPEAAALAGLSEEPRDLDGMASAARAVARLTPGAVLVKGRHLGEGMDAADALLLPGEDEPVVFRAPRVETSNTHGTGCTLSSAIACGLAEGLGAEEAVRRAKRYLALCLSSGLDVGAGSGPVDHMAPFRAAAPASGAAAVPVPGGREAGAAEGQGPARRGAAAGGPRVLVVGGSPERPSPQLLRALALQADLVVACDSGADACRAAGVAVDALVGDDDSVTPAGLAYARSTARDELAYPMDKDEVDLALAVEWARRLDPAPLDVTFTGVSGGRADHALVVLGVAARAADLAPAIEEDGASMRVLSPAGEPRWRLSPGDAGRTLSVVALLGPAVVSESGMRWGLDHARLEPLSDLGVSNVVESEGASVEVHEGVALVCLLRERVEKGPLGVRAR